MKQYHYDHRKASDLAELARDFAQAPAAVRPAILAELHDQKLMVAPLSLTAAEKLMRMRRQYRTAPAKEIQVFLLSRAEPLANDCWDDMIDHMLNGQCKTDALSAGGWNGEELQKVCSLLDEHGWKPARGTVVDLRSEAVKVAEEEFELDGDGFAPADSPKF